jgi:5-(aminomethyl)-3-furanmethanol phosphate kinase
MSGALKPAPCIVVKLGGSLASDPSLAQWLRELKSNRLARYVVVPGGGPFADAVRAAQSTWQFSDQVAHVMALGAMDLFGHMLCGLEAGLSACSTALQIEQAWARERLPVWLPAHRMSAERGLAHSWDVSSDTIAAWLAVALGASGLLLVKSCAVPVQWGDPAALARAGIVDPVLPGFLSRTNLTLNVVQRDGWCNLAQAATRMLRRD